MEILLVLVTVGGIVKGQGKYAIFTRSFRQILVYNFDFIDKPGKKVRSMVRIKNINNFQPSRLQPIVVTKF